MCPPAIRDVPDEGWLPQGARRIPPAPCRPAPGTWDPSVRRAGCGAISPSRHPHSQRGVGGHGMGGHGMGGHETPPPSWSTSWRTWDGWTRCPPPSNTHPGNRGWVGVGWVGTGPLPILEHLLEHLPASQHPPGSGRWWKWDQWAREHASTLLEKSGWASRAPCPHPTPPPPPPLPENTGWGHTGGGCGTLSIW